MSRQQDNLAVVVAWLDATRRGDLHAMTELFAPDVVWRGVPAHDVCRDRREVLDMLAGDELLPGQLFDVFTLTDCRIVAVQDFAARDEALLAADARAPQWA